MISFLHVPVNFQLFQGGGGEEQRDQLSFVILIRQIDAGLEKGYEEREIIDADIC